MALKDDVFKKYINQHSRSTQKKYNHFRLFDDPKKQSFSKKEAKSTKSEKPLKKSREVAPLSTCSKLKPDTNQTQNRHKTDTNPTQTRHKTDTNQTQSRHKPNTKSAQKQHKPSTEPDTQPNTNLTQNLTHYKKDIPHISMLSGIQLKLVFLVYEKCQLHRNNSTPPLSLEHICKHTNTVKGSIKTSLQRLIKSNFLIRESYKNGRSGWVKLRLPEQVYQEIINLNITSNQTQTQHKPDTEPSTEPNTSPSVVVSSNILNKTTTNKGLITLSEIDYSGLEDAGFTENHLFQIEREYVQKLELALPANIVQDSINALAFDLKHNNAAKSFKIPPVAALVGMLKKGKPYSSKTPDKYLSPRDEAMQEYLNAKEQRHNAERERIQRVKKIEFEEWADQLPESELLAMAPEQPKLPGLSVNAKKRLFRKSAMEEAQKYFDVEIWPERKQKILAGKAEKLAETS